MSYNSEVGGAARNFERLITILSSGHKPGVDPNTLLNVAGGGLGVPRLVSSVDLEHTCVRPFGRPRSVKHLFKRMRLPQCTVCGLGKGNGVVLVSSSPAGTSSNAISRSRTTSTTPPVAHWQ